MSISNYLLLVFPIVILVIYFYKARVFWTREFETEFLSIDKTKHIQALACLGVILHHVTQQITGYGQLNRGPITILSSMGIIFTAIFFFFSGYGLIVSYNNKKDYLGSFLWHRIPTILIPFWISNIIFILFNAIKNGRMESGNMLLKLLFGLKLINGNGWFIVEIFFLYLAFFVFFKFIRSKNVALVLLSVFTVALIYYSKIQGRDSDMLYPNSSWFKGEWWFNSTIVFIMGLWIGRFKEAFFTFVKKYYRIILFITSVALIIAFRYEEYIRRTYGYYVESFVIGGELASTKTLVAQMLLVLISTLWVILLSVKVTSNSKVMTIIGSFSMELFLVHNMFVKICAGGLIKGFFLRYCFVIGGSIPLAFIVSLVDKRLLGFIFAIAKRFYIPKGDEQTELTIEKRLKLERDRKRNRIIAIALVIIAVVALILKCGSSNPLLARQSASEELAMLEAADVGDEIYFGHYDQTNEPFDERLTWIVVSINDNRYLLVAKNGIDRGAYAKEHEAVAWQDSAIRARLNCEEFISCFSKYELEHIAKNDDGDMVSLLTESEASILSEYNRVCISTEIARGKGVNVNTYSKINQWDFKDEKASWWWVRPDNIVTEVVDAPVVTVDGVVDNDGMFVNNPNGTIRPAIIVEL